MEESTNTFTGGLNQDLNPIATPDNVLTDAKNATFITFNGNEMSLQNDMGNTKITYTDPLTNVKQSVTLPQGYVPLGVKEYGGILYIVSKNPSTEQVEIGSFPSPEFVSNDEKLSSVLNVEETKITDDSGVLLGGQSRSESGIFDISTEILHPCDRIKDYSFFPLNFETVSTQNERRLFKYKLINNSTRKDITNLSKPFNLSSKVWYKTLQLTKDKVRQDPVTVIFPKGGMYTYPVKGEAYGDKPDEFASYLYEVDGELKLSMYYEGGGDIRYTLSEQLPGGKTSGPLPGKNIPILYKFDDGGDGIYYFPNLQPGTLSFKFYTETIDYFNLHRIEDQVVKYSPKLVEEAFKFNDKEEQEIIELFATTFFTNGDGATPNEFISPSNVYGNTIRPDALNKYSLWICPENGYKYSRPDTFDSALKNESNRFMTLHWSEGEGEDEGKFTSTIEINDKQQYLKFNKIKLSQPSWVKVNRVVFHYEIFHNDNPSVIIKSDSKICDNINVNDDEWDISHLSIEIPSEGKKVNLGVFMGKSNYFPKYLGTASNGNIELSPFKTITVSSAKGRPNYTVRFSFVPYNTDYNIDISQFKIDRTIDLTKSPDSWEGNLVFKDNPETINVSLDNCVIQYNDPNGTKKFTTLEECENNNNLLTSILYQKYFRYQRIPLNTTSQYFPANDQPYFIYSNVTPNWSEVTDRRRVGYYIEQENVITLLKQTEPSLRKYFNWKGIISPNIKDATGNSVDTGSLMMINYGNTSDYRVWNILKVDNEDSSKSVQINKNDKGELLAPGTISIKSENGIFDGRKIKRGLIGERSTDQNSAFIALALYEQNYSKYIEINTRRLGFSISPTELKYLGAGNNSVKFSKLYYISKNASTTPCDSFGKTLIESELPKDVKGFDNIISEDVYSVLYASIVPIKSYVLSRANIVIDKPYTSSSFSPSDYFTFTFYISPNFIGDLTCNADVLKLSIDNDVKLDDDDNVIFSPPQYLKNTSINIKSGNKKYNRVVLICDGSSLSEDDFTFKFSNSNTNNGIIYNPILYQSRFENESSTICADLRGQGMKLTFSEDISEFNNKLLGGYKLHANYVPVPFYEIID